MLLAVEFDNLHQVLRVLYDEMMPLCGDMTGVAKGIAGLGALFYVAVRVWQAMARAEPIDVYPLLRLFAIGICILLFPTQVLGTLNNTLGLIVEGTHSMLEIQTMDMHEYREQKDRLEWEAMLRNPETAYLVSDKELFFHLIFPKFSSAYHLVNEGAIVLPRLQTRQMIQRGMTLATDTIPIASAEIIILMISRSSWSSRIPPSELTEFQIPEATSSFTLPSSK